MKYLHTSMILFLVAFYLVGCGGNSTRYSTFDESNAYTDIESYFDSLMFSGTILVKKEGEEMARRSFGYADKEVQIPNSMSTRFRIGSLTKTFTALAIVQLKKAGQLSYDDPLSKYVPDFVRGDEITIRHLLTQRSGILDYLATGRINENQSYTLLELIALVQERDLLFEPDSQFTYSNTNYMLLGYIIEQVSGMEYDSYISTEITTPLGMNATEVSPRYLTGEEYAKGYTNLSQDRLADFHDISIPNAAGAFSSTMNDMEKWAEAFYDSELITEEDKAEIFAGDTYGFGWVLSPIDGKKVYWHNGGISGFSSILVLLPEEKGVIIILSNVDNQHSQINIIVSTLIEHEFGGEE